MPAVVSGARRQTGAVRGLVLTGVDGTGKSTLAEVIADALENAGLAYAAIDLDWLCWSSVAGGDDGEHTDVFYANVAAVVGNYVAAGVDHVVTALALRDRAALGRLAGAFGFRPAVVRLSVPIGVISRRLAAAATDGRRQDAETAGRWLDDAVGAELGDLVVVNDRPVAEVGAEILDWLGWIG